ncbi:MAG: hypothetical protein IGS48_16030 [Oscillatoriales cyanobacterium C42_A2020_001]|nr:hypothetical protein [Leptolyngbyaceae cyanobacterium C42_A2020_001]
MRLVPAFLLVSTSWLGALSGVSADMKPLELTVEGNRLTLSAPANARVKPASQFGVEVIVSDRIQLTIETLADETSIAEYKKDTLANTGIFKRFLVDTPTALLHEDMVVSNPAYRVFTYADTGKVKVTCRDSRVIDLSETEARTVMKLCQSIRSKL